MTVWNHETGAWTALRGGSVRHRRCGSSSRLRSTCLQRLPCGEEATALGWRLAK